jgi:hypothetical protein
MELARDTAARLRSWWVLTARGVVRVLEKDAAGGIEQWHPNIVRVFHWDKGGGHP